MTQPEIAAQDRNDSMWSATRPTVNSDILDLIGHKQCLCKILDADDTTPEAKYQAIVELASLGHGT